MSDITARNGQLLAVPYQPFKGDPKKNDVILDGLLALPVFPIPGTPEERRVAIAWVLTDSDNLIWEIWQDGQLIGIFLLTRVIRGLNALAHLAFFDRQLLGRRQLVLNAMDWAFRELALQRISVEIPESLAPLIRFCRTKLGFRFEGEVPASMHPTVQQLTRLRVNGQAQWVAKWGSRLEHMHFDEARNEWVDLVCLRVLRDEFLKS
jgi:RimJ/RimL family protein N-acetyltransferase